MPAPTVFISYSHQDEAWKKKLLPHLHALEQAGIGMQVWHDRRIDGGDKWYPEIQQAMANAAAAVLLISPDFLASRFCVQEEVPALLKRQEDEGMLLIPVLIRECPWKAHRWLKDRQMLPRDGKSVAIDFAGDLADAVFSAVAGQVLVRFEQLASQPSTAMAVPVPVQLLAAQPVTADPAIIAPRPAPNWPTPPAEHVDLTRLPETGSALFGRDEELALLDQAWTSSEEGNATPVRIFVLTAHGGVGKSTLVNHWLADMARDQFRGATRIFGWSFYSQGVRQETAASADSFIDAALRFFGDVDPTAGSPWDKGERLARLVGSHRALLVLDGLEPLQSAQPFERGKLRDAALESLLRGLARHSAGLCLITTREQVTDLAGRPGVTSRDLEQITPQAGRALLRTLRVVGTDAELEFLASRFGPHALAVSLLGVYLREQPGHGIGPAQEIEQLPGNKPIDRVLAAFEQWLGDSPEREALRLLGFFDRPADAGCLRALGKPPPIAGLTNRVTGIDDANWDRVTRRLEGLRLVHLQHGEPGQQSVDAHPLVREHFAELMKSGTGWQAGHQRLYEHLCETTKEGALPTLEDLQPLYQAVTHGCQAGLQREAYHETYGRRILRGNQFYSWRKLGSFGSDLGAVACFFETPWNCLSTALDDGDQAALLSQAAFYLRALGRLAEALGPIRSGLEMCIKQKDWGNAAIVANNLSDLQLTLGDVAGAVAEAAESVTYADRSGDEYQRVARRTTYADALHQAGNRAEAKIRFREAGQLKDAVSEFQYGELILAEAERAAWQRQRAVIFRPMASPARSAPVPLSTNAFSTPLEVKSATARPSQTATGISPLLESCRAVSERAAQTLERAGRNNWLLDIALSHLTLGRAALYAALLSSESLSPLVSAASGAGPSSGAVSLRSGPSSHLESAVAGLRQAGTTHHIPRALLTRAWLRSLSGARTGPESAQTDLEEAWEIAERGPMPLFMADIHLHRARLLGAMQDDGESIPYPWKSPAADLSEARRLIEKHGYLRRMEELEDAEAAILNRPRSQEAP